VRADALIEALRAIEPSLRKEYGVAALHVFGSVARGEETSSSDLDLLVDFEGPPTFAGFMDLKLRLEDVLGVTVDLATRKALRPSMRARIEAEARRVV
jgi:predicted nucleotidyltransferase